ncbi:MAG: DUF983 domain-containing protein [Chitinophagaceae bacterium]|nr:DUF983 domain-containing protein [Chitinophagaceae bacterium]
MDRVDHKPPLLLSIFKNKCPRCRRGHLYKGRNPYKRGFMIMNNECPVCRQAFDMEPGFYYGTGFVSYGLSVAICVATFLTWWVIIGFSLKDNRFFWWMGLNALLLIIMQPLLMRISRTIWLAIFVHYSADWNKGDIVRSERINKDQMGNW